MLLTSIVIDNICPKCVAWVGPIVDNNDGGYSPKLWFAFHGDIGGNSMDNLSSASKHYCLKLGW